MIIHMQLTESRKKLQVMQGFPACLSLFLFFPFGFWLFAAKRRQRRGRKSGGKEKRKIAQPF